ncbi:hypothetical protein [Enterobacter asburiae]|uniref:hypothetical protein n=1 Tax=Enterobacter asburiae TaxID=61645 RepID=UPI002162DE4A|nr:hypothetical protein [Enterobacter asburiae]MCS0626717.1 hypothetical protein [Enterobacter asburiae]
MAKNDFKPFATAANANVTSQADWEALPALLSGFISGPAKSAQVNKAIRQASFIAAALAQYVANKSGQDVLDDGDLNGFIEKLVSGLAEDFMETGAFGLGIRNEELPSTMAAVDVTRFDYFAPKDNIGPIPGQWVGGMSHAMGNQIGWQIAGLGQGAVGGSPRAFMRMKLSNGNFSNWGELYHTLNKPTADDVGALPVNGKAASASAADTAAKLTTARRIAGIAFDGTADISLAPDNVGAVSAGGGDYNKNFRLGSVATLGNESNPVQLISAASGQAADNFVAWTSYTWYQDYVRTGVVRAGNTTIKSFAVEINGVRFLEIGRDGTLLNGNMASDLRLGQQESMNVNIPGSGQSIDSVVPSGCYVTGLTSTSTGNYIGITKIFYRRLQRKVAGNWVDATWL